LQCRPFLRSPGLPTTRRIAALAALLLLIAAGLGLTMIGRSRDLASCEAFSAPGTEVWLAVGQSNAANYAEHRVEAGPGVAMFDGRRCRPARDPLPGGDGKGGSLWTPLADIWIREGGANRVLIAMSAQSATAIAEWQPGGRLHRLALDTVSALRSRGLRVTRILWVQGEADSILSTPGPTYARALAAALEPLHRASGAPVHVALAARCGDAFSSEVREAQVRVAAGFAWTRPGPDLDSIGPGERFERCHFARTGQIRAVALWKEALAANPDLRNRR
jgi:hypothetical protein